MQEFDEMFYHNPYLQEFDTQVIKCMEDNNGYAVVLQDTIFYPEGGGQPCDKGTINDCEVTDVKRHGDEIWHYTHMPLEPGTSVHCKINWERRFDHMQNHTGEHMISGLIHKHYGFNNIGFHLGQEIVQIDFDGFLTMEQLLEIEREANHHIFLNEKIVEAYPSQNVLKQLEYRSKIELEGKVRLVEIPDCDVCACCGTHVKYTGEIGSIRILSVSRYKQGVRIEMVSGYRALHYMEDVHIQNQKVSELLSARPLETSQAVEKVLVHQKEASLAYNSLMMKYMKLRSETVPVNQKLAVLFEEGLSRGQTASLCNALVTERNAESAAVLNLEKNAYSFMIISRTLNLKEKMPELNQRLQGRGGGKPDSVQGSFAASQEEILNVLKEILR